MHAEYFPWMGKTNNGKVKNNILNFPLTTYLPGQEILIVTYKFLVISYYCKLLISISKYYKNG